ncbi:PPOX class F420-dependent oxidoreductase [Nocardia sp. NPDC059239]|uniref:PPOX class F420-dependent oxidoreductase n=1 Tax=unclassified Nocardia TaxID=2637762 RepID=UPI0036B77D9B
MTSTAARPELSPAAADFVAERHLATLSTLRANGTPHVVAVGFTWDPEAGIARIITNDGSVKVNNVRRSGYAVVSQVDGPRWITLEGPATVLDDADSVADAVERYAGRYRQPRVNPTRVVIAIDVQRVMASSVFKGDAAGH